MVFPVTPKRPFHPYRWRNAAGYDTYYAYADDNSLTQLGRNATGYGVYFFYDSNGSCTKLHSVSGTTYFEYTAFDRVKTIAVLGGDSQAVTYDGDLQRLSVGNRIYTWDGTRLLDIRLAAGEIIWRFAYGTSPVPGIGDCVQAITSGNTAYYLVLDQRGSVVQVLNASKTVVATAEYNAYGQMVITTGAWPDDGTYGIPLPFRYHSDYIYLDRPELPGGITALASQTRVIFPDYGVFGQRDPLGNAASLPGLQSQYQAFAGDPVNKVDPLGLIDWWAIVDFNDCIQSKLKELNRSSNGSGKCSNGEYSDEIMESIANDCLKYVRWEKAGFSTDEGGGAIVPGSIDFHGIEIGIGQSWKVRKIPISKTKSVWQIYDTAMSDREYNDIIIKINSGMSTLLEVKNPRPIHPFELKERRLLEKKLNTPVIDEGPKIEVWNKDIENYELIVDPEWIKKWKTWPKDPKTGGIITQSEYNFKYVPSFWSSVSSSAAEADSHFDTFLNGFTVVEGGFAARTAFLAWQEARNLNRIYRLTNPSVPEYARMVERSSIQIDDILYTQKTAGGSRIKTGQYKGMQKADVFRLVYSEKDEFYSLDPLDFVTGPDGIRTLDHTRLTVAREQGILSIPGRSFRIHAPNEVLPPHTLLRFNPEMGPFTITTFGDAVLQRAARQGAKFPRFGTPVPPKMPASELPSILFKFKLGGG